MRIIFDRFSDNLRRIRREKGLTVVELALKSGVSQSMITSYENGVIPRRGSYIKLLKALEKLGVSEKELYISVDEK